MFDFLKKKISGFIDGITKKEEEKGEPAQAKIPEKEEELILEIPEPEAIIGPQEKPAKKEAKPPPKKERAGKEAAQEQEPKKARSEPKKEPARDAKKEPEKAPGKAPEKPTLIAIPIPKKEPVSAKPPAPAKEKPEPAKEAQAPKPIQIQKPAPEAKPVPGPKPEPAPIAKQIIKPAPEPEPEPVLEEEPEPDTDETREEEEPAPEPVPGQKPEPAPRQAPIQARGEEKPKERIKLGLFGAVKSFVTREVEISEKDVKDMVESLELELLEADVDIGVAEGIKEELMGKLVGSKVGKDKLHSFVSNSIRETLTDILTNEKNFDIVTRVSSTEKPVKIMFIGINGAGKTTTIAKVAKLLMDNDKKVVFAAADTFRAAAIEQMAVHAERLNVKMVAREYGSDPTSVAYDAVNYAKAHGADAVLIDTAGRQDTNISLLNEMKKMKRVINPDICIYIGESIAGNAILEQISAFNREVGVDAVILSKLDCDPKGGTMLSISKATGVPIIYVGVGQGYDALERFDPHAIVGRIVE